MRDTAEQCRERNCVAKPTIGLNLSAPSASLRFNLPLTVDRRRLNFDHL
jgi:hypothetical protein